MKDRKVNRRVLLLIESARAYGRGIITGVARYAREHGHWTIFYEEREILTTIPTSLKEWKGDGIICRTSVSPLGRYLRNLGVPLIELLGDQQRFVCDVPSDAIVAGQMAADHFIERGLQHFAYYSYGNAWWAQARGDAFADALVQKGLTCHRLTTHDGKKVEAFPEWQAAYGTKLLRWLSKLPTPIGIWCACDTFAQQVHSAVTKLGLTIPDEVALLGIDNDEHLCNVLTPTLSSIDPNSIAIGYQAAKRLEAKMDRHAQKRTKPFHEETPTPISPLGVVVRQSTDVIAVDDPQLVSIVRFIRNNALQGIHVAEVARQFDISRRTLERRFRQHFGRTVDQEITSLRLEHAKFLLRETQLPIAEIGEQTGFDPHYFTKAFHRIVGVSPNAYRLANRMGVPLKPHGRPQK